MGRSGRAPTFAVVGVGKRDGARPDLPLACHPIASLLRWYLIDLASGGAVIVRQ